MSNGSSRGVYYRVEARSTYSSPEDVGGFLLDQRWREIPISTAPSGVGIPSEGWNNAAKHGYYSFEAAEALRWWFLANQLMGGLCIETRLVAYDYEESYSAKRRADGPALERPRRPWDDFTPIASEQVDAA